MARETFGTLVQAAQDYSIDDTATTVTGLSSAEAFLKRETNHSVKDIFTLMKKYKLQPPPKTASTVSGQIYYHNPPGMTKIESVTIATGTIVPPLRIIHSQDEWNRLQMIPVTNGYPLAVFPRRDDFGIYPTPNAVYTLTLVGNYEPINMTADDYSTATVTATQNSQTITGSGTTFTSTMVGRWFSLTDSNGVSNGNWYRISAFTSTTSITLESYFEEATVTGGTYIIGESPEIPEELHEFIPFRSSAVYYATRRRDLEQAQRMMNYYYTGDFNNPNRSGNIRGGVLAVLKDLKENGRGNSQVTEMGPTPRINTIQLNNWSSTYTS